MTTSNPSSLRSPLSITTQFDDNEADGGDDDDANNNMNNDAMDTIPLQTKILNVVKSSPDYTIRPAKLAQELGMSVTEASAELCGLLKAVGEGSTFQFETIKGGGAQGGNAAAAVHTMVFTFPPDFEARARSFQQRDDWKQSLWSVLQVTWKLLKILTAFGLILSTVIVAAAGMVALIAAMLAMSRGGNHRARHQLSQQIHALFIMIRQLLWAYALFGPTGDGEEGDHQDPFFREAAYDTSLVLSLCCGNPASLWFWLRASHLRRRRRRMARGWGRIHSSLMDDSRPSDLEGVRLIRRGPWGEQEIPIPPATADERQGLLSIAIEFLFGPTTNPGPSQEDRWRLRSAVIVEKSQQSQTSSISLQELIPFVDNPPAQFNETSKVVSEGLLVVAHFNGVPSSKHETSNLPEDLVKAQFVFPELLAESTVNIRYDDPTILTNEPPSNIEQERWWKGLLFSPDISTTTFRNTAISPSSTMTPDYLYEQSRPFTKLTARQFYHCLFVAILNWIGVLWFAQSLAVGGILEQTLNQQLVRGLQLSLIPILRFYANLFFLIAFVRLGFILLWNYSCRQRNRKRCYLSTQLKTSLVTVDEKLPSVAKSTATARPQIARV